MRIFHDADMAGQPGSGMNRFLQYCDKGIFEIHEDTVKNVFKFAMPADGVIPNNPRVIYSSDAVSGKSFKGNCKSCCRFISEKQFKCCISGNCTR